METVEPGVSGVGAGCLETFLVEWKPPCTPRALLCRMVLETFLVEWKPILGIDSRGMVLNLETFLVEWKLSEAFS